MAERVKRPRRTQAERSEETKRRLIEATIDLLVERGYARLTVADIARRAGVSNGARVHHFPTKEALVVAANERAYDDAIKLGTQRARSASRSRNPVASLIADLGSLYFGRFFQGSLDSMIAARTDRRLARRLHPIVGRYHQEMRDLWTRALEEAGYSAKDAAMLYEAILGIVRGMALKSTWRPDPRDSVRIVSAVAKAVLAQVSRGPRP